MNWKNLLFVPIFFFVLVSCGSSATTSSTSGRVHSCGAAYDLVYHLLFYQNGTVIDNMDLNPSGCPNISMKKGDIRSVSEAFISLFAKTIGVPTSQIHVQPVH